MTLFENPANASIGLHFPDVVELLEKMWEYSKEYVDSNLQNRFGEAVDELNAHPIQYHPDGTPLVTNERSSAVFKFHQAYWELHCLTLFKHMGFKLTNYDRSEGGPDILIDHEGTKIWVECVAPTPGTGPNAVPPMITQRISDKPLKTQAVPVNEITLRITEAIARKRTILVDSYLKNGIVSNDDVYVIAVNGSSVWLGNPDFDEVPPLALRCLYGLGEVAVEFANGEFGDPFIQEKNEICNAKGTPISNKFFELDDFKAVSGLIYSRVNAFNFRGSIEDSAFCIPNINADTLCPDDFMDAFLSYRPEVRDGMLSIPKVERHRNPTPNGE